MSKLMRRKNLNKTNIGEFFRFLKMFCATFVLSTIISVIVPKILYMQKHINLSELFILACALPLAQV